MTNTPLFDTALSDYYKTEAANNSVRTCKVTGQPFTLRKEDVEYYKSHGLPLPSIHPLERLRRKAAYQNAEHLFKITDHFSGEHIIATYPDNTPYKIIDHTSWLSDSWDPLHFGLSYNPTEPLFSELKKLSLAVPRPNLVTNSTNTRSDYSNISTYLTDCYLAFGATQGEFLYYFACCKKNSHCVNCAGLWNCSHCFDCENLYDCFNCIALRESKNCLDCAFLYDCKTCEHCFMSSGLRNKKYFFRNKALTKHEYESKIKDVHTGSFTIYQKLRDEWRDLIKYAPRKEHSNINSVNCFGDEIKNSKDCYHVIMCYDSVNTNYSVGFANYRDSYDILGGYGGELCYELCSYSTENNYNIKCSAQVSDCRDCEYSDLLTNCANCFACVGLRNKNFCILNRQYTEKEYWKTIDLIKTDMMKDNLYGEFFPPTLSPVPYLSSQAYAYPGLRDLEHCAAYGYDMRDLPQSLPAETEKTISADDLPDSISDVTDEIQTVAIFDPSSNRHFKITRYELEFYRKHILPLPRVHPLTRLQYFRDHINQALTYLSRTCGNCGKHIKTTLTEDLYKNVWCETCYTDKHS